MPETERITKFGIVVRKRSIDELPQPKYNEVRNEFDCPSPNYCLSIFRYFNMNNYEEI